MYNTKLPNLMTIDEIVKISKENHANEIRKQQEKYEEEQFYEENWHDIHLATILESVDRGIRSALTSGKMDTGIICIPLCDGTLQDLAELYESVKEALSSYDAEIKLRIPNKQFLQQYYNKLRSGMVYAAAGFQHHQYRGFEIKVSWSDEVYQHV